MLKPILAFGALVTAAVAAPASKVMTLNGSCELLVILGEDLSSDCSDRMANTAYPDGRSGFYFVTKSGPILTFSGQGRRQVKKGPNRAIQPVDVLIFGDATGSDRIKAVGQCEFENPYGRSAHVECFAKTADGDFRVKFLTDGQPPKISSF